MERRPPPNPETIALLESGRVLSQRYLPSSNYTFLVELGADGPERCLGVYKPKDGETPLWDFPHYTLYKRERLAFLVSEALGWGVVPLTVIRDGPHGVGSMQLFIHARRGAHYFNLLPEHKEEMLRIALFDCIVNNCDRKGGHCLVDAEGRVWAIDHGLTFSPGAKLRTVMWDFAEERVPAHLRGCSEPLCGDGALREALGEHLSPPEVEAFYRRVEVVLASDTVPIPNLSDPYRPVPWPTI